MSPLLQPWSVRAVNLAEHADNPVHTREGGLAAGYAGAVVAGTTVYAYLTRPAAEAWGADWVGGGTAEVRFHAPVLAHDAVTVVPVEGADGDWVIEAHNPTGRCATLAVGLTAGDPPDPVGERLEPFVEVFGERWAGYADRVGEDLPLYAASRLAHPVIWPSLANRVFATQLVDGAWVHTRSVVRHLGTAAPGDTVVVEAWLTDRFTTRAGDRAVIDVRISVDRRAVAAIEHEAIVRLAG
ncbi:MAG: hypothetical protein R2707_18370 [Acidimicrobiales bacterium]